MRAVCEMGGGVPLGVMLLHYSLKCHIQPEQEAGKALARSELQPGQPSTAFPFPLANSFATQGASRSTSLGLGFPICKIQTEAAKWRKGLSF